MCRRRYYNTIPSIPRKTNKREFHPPSITFPRALDIYQNWIFVFRCSWVSDITRFFPLCRGKKISVSSEGRESFDIRMERVSSARRTCTTIEEKYEYLGLADIVHACWKTLLGSTRFSICPRRTQRNLWRGRKEKGLMPGSTCSKLESKAYKEWFLLSRRMGPGIGGLAPQTWQKCHRTNSTFSYTTMTLVLHRVRYLLRFNGIVRTEDRWWNVKRYEWKWVELIVLKNE